MVNFPTWNSDCDCHSPTLLDLFISFDASICSTTAFHSLGNSEHVAVSVSLDFPSDLGQGATLHSIAYDYSCADWDHDWIFDHLRDAPRQDIFKLSASAADSNL